MKFFILSFLLVILSTLAFCYEKDRACFEELLKAINLDNKGNTFELIHILLYRSKRETLLVTN